MSQLIHKNLSLYAAAAWLLGSAALPVAAEPDLAAAIKPPSAIFQPRTTTAAPSVRKQPAARARRPAKKPRPALVQSAAPSETAATPGWRQPQPPVASHSPFIPDATEDDPMPLSVRRASAVQAVSYRLVKAAGVPCHVVQVNLDNPHVRLRTLRARDLGSRYRSFGSFVRRARPIAAITGTFFDTQTGTIIANLVRDGKLLEAGSVGQTIALDEKNRARWLSTAGQYGGAHDWKDSEFAVSSGPSLVHDGEVCLDPSSEGFSDPGLFRQAARTGVAVTHNGKLLLVSVNRGVSLGRFARMMQELGALHALNLDGGSSTALYARGRYLSHPGRRLTNVLMVTVRPGDPLPRKVHLDVLDASSPVEASANEPYFDAPPEPEVVDLGVQTIVP